MQLIRCFSGQLNNELALTGHFSVFLLGGFCVTLHFLLCLPSYPSVLTNGVAQRVYGFMDGVQNILWLACQTGQLEHSEGGQERSDRRPEREVAEVRDGLWESGLACEYV